MLGKDQTIQAKVTFLFVFVVVVCALLFGALAMFSLSSLSDKQIEMTESELKQSVVNSMQDAGKLSGERVSKLIEQSYTPLTVVAEVLKQTSTPNTPLSREQVKHLARDTLNAVDSLSAVYIHFEQNAYDAKDSSSLGMQEHSTPTGSLEIYWVKENGQANYYPVDDANEKYANSRDENGIREAEWYLCSRDALKPCALDPYLYEIEPGNEQLMTTLTVPVMVAGEFRGLIGSDINLPVVQRWIEEQAKSLFGGKSSITLISQKQLLIASSKYPDDLSKSAEATDGKLTKVLNASSTVITEQNEWFVKVPVPIPQAGVEWTLIVSVPKNVAMATIDKMLDSADSSFSSAIFEFLLFSILFVGGSIVFALWLAKSISSPIKVVSSSIQSLAEQEGDLTHKVHIESHKELILLANGFNKFINKLAEMIGSSKNYSEDLVQQFKRLGQISHDVELDTKTQQSELDNIATAMTEMAATATQVAQLAAGTAEGGAHANGLLSDTQSLLSESVDEVRKLEQDMTVTSEQISKVAERSNDITSIVETIQSIAEQTNLLALNAAIEAARAGEQGRGFAVVADEVRSLAARTQSSTQDISELISNLHNDVEKAVQTLEQIQSTVSGTVDKTNVSFERLTETMGSIQEINESSVQVATAAEEQSQVSEDINMRIVTVTDSSKALAELGQELKSNSKVSEDLVHGIEDQLSRLKC